MNAFNAAKLLIAMQSPHALNSPIETKPSPYLGDGLRIKNKIINQTQSHWKGSKRVEFEGKSS